MAFHSNRQRTDSVPQIQLQVVFQGKKKKGEAQNRMCQTLSSIFQQLWLTGNVIVDWNLANVQSIYKDWKENPDNYKSVSLTLVWEEVLEQRILSAIPWHMQDTRLASPAVLGLSEAAAAWLTWYPMTGWPTWRMKERLRTSANSLTLSPTTFSWRSWQPVACTGACSLLHKK